MAGIKRNDMTDMRKSWMAAGLNPEHYTAACADVMLKYAEPFVKLLNEYKEWEAMLIEDNAMWWPSVPKDRISGKSYDKMMELQEKRNDLLSR